MEDDKVKGVVEVVAVVVWGLHELHNFAQKVEKGWSDQLNSELYFE